ncbi:MAG: hypothetical protein JST00_45320 [Deltaproteobacteria bacterium]|nr:hypothetical protein [Deltaproteobacteria bacterium]
MRLKELAAAAIALGVLLAPGTSSAQNTAASAAAEKLFREGKALAASQRYEEAIEKFTASQELEPSVGVLLSLGDAYRARGRVASAWSAYTSARDLAKTKGDARVIDAEQRAAEVSPRLPRLTIHVVAPVPDIQVTDNGLPLPRASFGTSLPVDPGVHTIVATAKGRRTFRGSTSVAEAQAGTIDVPILELDPLASDARRDDGRGDTQRTIGTSLLVGGGAVTAVGLVFGGIALSKWSSVESACPDRVCDTNEERSATEGDARAADRFAVASTVTVGIGLAAVAAGIVLRMIAPSRTTTTTTGDRFGLGGTF